jgi:tRNA G18 (ribose-2'-O)-methylase SpoU
MQVVRRSRAAQRELARAVRDDPSLVVLRGQAAVRDALPSLGASQWAVHAVALSPTLAASLPDARTVLAAAVWESSLGVSSASVPVLPAASVWVLSPDSIRALAGMHGSANLPTADIALVLARQPGASLALPDLLARPSPLLFLDGVADPGNVGTCLRSAWFFGAGAALLGPGSASPWGHKALAASKGASLFLPCTQLASWEEVVATHLDLPALLVADASPADSHRGALSLRHWTTSQFVSQHDLLVARRTFPTWGLLLGSEGSGISPACRGVLSRWAARAPVISATIATPHTVPGACLNVSVAGGVLLSWLADALGRADALGSAP